MNPIFGDSFLSSKWFSPNFWFDWGSFIVSGVFNFFVIHIKEIMTLFHTALFFLGLFFFTLISYCIIRIFEIRKKEHAHLRHEIEEFAHHQAEREKKRQEGEGGSKNERWVKTLSFLFSQHHSDWKLAVIEADAMLESLLNQLGFKGETLGDKLKGATQEKFRSLTSAWEVHTIRNRIAHEGDSFQLSQHEAKRVITLYEQIFREFGYI